MRCGAALIPLRDDSSRSVTCWLVIYNLYSFLLKDSFPIRMFLAELSHLTIICFLISALPLPWLLICSIIPSNFLHEWTVRFHHYRTQYQHFIEHLSIWLKIPHHLDRSDNNIRCLVTRQELWYIYQKDNERVSRRNYVDFCKTSKSCHLCYHPLWLLLGVCQI